MARNSFKDGSNDEMKEEKFLDILFSEKYNSVVNRIHLKENAHAVCRCCSVLLLTAGKKGGNNDG